MMPPDFKPVVIGYMPIVQGWSGGKPFGVFTEEPLTDIDDLNSYMPKPWELNPNGNERPPYQPAQVLYLRDLTTGERCTFISGTTGARIVIARLRDRIDWECKRRRNNDIVVQVEFSRAPMPTRHKTVKQRPEFKVIGVVDLEGGGTLLPPLEVKQLPPAKPKEALKEPTVAEDLNDKIHFEC